MFQCLDFHFLDRQTLLSLSLSLALSLSLSSSHLELMESIGVLTLKFSVEFKEMMVDPSNGPTLANTARPTPPPYPAL